MNDAKVLVKLEDIDRYEEAVDAYVSLRMEPDRFMAARLQNGIYGQRQEGVHMVRIKIPGGRLTPPQLDTIAEVLDTYSQHDVAHITTRQDIQLHYVPLMETAKAMRKLASAGLTTREACGNTIRNITACPLTGLCAGEHVDVTPFVDAAVAHFLRHPLTQHMPRKFKISFSGCEADCAQGMIHDVGVVAVKRNGRFGFKVMAGGGLGHKPHEAIVVEPFIEEKDLLASVEAVISLHHRYSDRTKRAKSRVKFLVDKFGPEGFVEKYKEEYVRTQAAHASKPYAKGNWVEAVPGKSCGAGAPREVVEQKQPGLYIFPIAIPLGDMTAEQMRGIARLMSAEKLDDVRTTQDQNLILVNVPQARIETIRKAINELQLGTPQAGDNVVACPGTSTCRLGITSSKIAGARLNGGPADLRIRVSGCHNGCAQPETGDIGIYGEGRRMHGRLIPHYQMYFGGDGQANGGIALKGPSVPSARVEQAVQRVKDEYLKNHENAETFFQWTRRVGKEHFQALLADLTLVNENEVQSVIHDHGDENDFKVLQLGGGECAGAAQEDVAASFSEAAHERGYRNTFVFQRKYLDAIECAEVMIRLVGKSLLFTATRKRSDNLDEIKNLLGSELNTPSKLAERLNQLSDGFAALKLQLDEAQLTKLIAELDAWMNDAARYCMEVDKQLSLDSVLA